MLRAKSVQWLLHPGVITETLAPARSFGTTCRWREAHFYLLSSLHLFHLGYILSSLLFRTCTRNSATRLFEMPCPSSTSRASCRNRWWIIKRRCCATPSGFEEIVRSAPSRLKTHYKKRLQFKFGQATPEWNKLVAPLSTPDFSWKPFFTGRCIERRQRYPAAKSGYLCNHDECQKCGKSPCRWGEFLPILNCSCSGLVLVGGEILGPWTRTSSPSRAGVFLYACIWATL